MSIYALVHFPDIDTTRINEFRDQYDPYRGLIDVHITIVKEFELLMMDANA